MRAFGRTLYLNKMYRRCSLMGGAKKKKKEKERKERKTDRRINNRLISKYQKFHYNLLALSVLSWKTLAS